MKKLKSPRGCQKLKEVLHANAYHLTIEITTKNACTFLKWSVCFYEWILRIIMY